MRASIGLNTLERFYTTTDQAAERPQATVTTGTGSSPCDLVEAGICVGDYQPQDLWKVYDMPSSDEGQGQTLGIFMEGVTASVVANLRVFEQRMDLPEVPVTVVPRRIPATPPDPPTTPVGSSGTSTPMRRQAWRRWWIASTTTTPNSLYDADVETEFSKWADDANGPLQMNASFGECETNPGNPITGGAADPELPFGQGLGDNLEPVAEGTLEQAALEGRTLFASAGDTGGSCPAVAAPIIGAGNGIANEGYPAINYPCGSDFAVCVGGTVLYTNVDSNNDVTSRNTEYSWTHTGGGSSFFIGQPDFQQKYLGSTPNAPGYRAATVHAEVRPHRIPGRNRVPDGARYRGAVGRRAHQRLRHQLRHVLVGKRWYEPLVAALRGHVDAHPGGRAARQAPARWDWVSPTRRSTGLRPVRTGPAPRTSRPFTDITVGSNGQHVAATGYDETSGWGVFDVANFIADPLADNNPTATPTDPKAQATVPAEPIAGACQPLFTTYAGNATDPVTDMNDANLDITSGSLGLGGTTLVAKLIGPSLAPGPMPQVPTARSIPCCGRTPEPRTTQWRTWTRRGPQVFYNDGNTE